MPKEKEIPNLRVVDPRKMHPEFNKIFLARREKFLPDLGRLDKDLPGESPLDFFRRNQTLPQEFMYFRFEVGEKGPVMKFMVLHPGRVEANTTTPGKTVRWVKVTPSEGHPIVVNTLTFSRSEGVVPVEENPEESKPQLQEMECLFKDGSKMELKRPVLTTIPQGILMERPRYRDIRSKLHRWFDLSDHQALVECVTKGALFVRGGEEDRGMELSARRAIARVSEETREAVSEAAESLVYRTGGMSGRNAVFVKNLLELT